MLEVLGSVQASRDQGFGALEHLVLGHAETVSGCICVLQSWDKTRQEFIRKLRILEVPLLVFVVVNPGDNEPKDPGPLTDAPEQFHVLRAGCLDEDLAKLK